MSTGEHKTELCTRTRTSWYPWTCVRTCPSPDAPRTRPSQLERARARAQAPTQSTGTRVRKSQLCAASAPAFLGAERPLVDVGRGADFAARSSPRVQWRVRVWADPSPTRSGPGSMWASSSYIKVRMGQEGPQGSTQSQDGATGWDPHFFPHIPDPYIPPVDACAPRSGGVWLALYSPAPGLPGGPLLRVGSLVRRLQERPGASPRTATRRQHAPRCAPRVAGSGGLRERPARCRALASPAALSPFASFAMWTWRGQDWIHAWCGVASRASRER